MNKILFVCFCYCGLQYSEDLGNSWGRAYTPGPVLFSGGSECSHRPSVAGTASPGNLLEMSPCWTHCIRNFQGRGLAISLQVNLLQSRLEKAAHGFIGKALTLFVCWVPSVWSGYTEKWGDLPAFSLKEHGGHRIERPVAFYSEKSTSSDSKVFFKTLESFFKKII